MGSSSSPPHVTTPIAAQLDKSPLQTLYYHKRGLQFFAVHLGYRVFQVIEHSQIISLTLRERKLRGRQWLSVIRTLLGPDTYFTVQNCFLYKKGC